MFLGDPVGVSSSDLLKTKKGRRGGCRKVVTVTKGQFPCSKYPFSYACPVHILRLSQVHTERKKIS